MAIQFNDITAIGDVFIVKANTPMMGVQTISGYVDDVLGETGTRYFDREFRYSENGITYTDWDELTDLNLQDTFVGVEAIFDIQYRYTRAGTDTTGFLTFFSIDLIGEIEEVENPKIFTDLYFNQFFNYNDDAVLRWALNVLDKLYQKGIVAKYLERDEEDGTDDDDYIALFGAVSHFFAILVRYAREFRDFTLNDILLLDYLKQKNVFLCDDMELADLQTMLANLYINFLERGTNEISKAIGEDGRVLDGELLRLLCKADTDEFLFALIEKEKTIWNVNNNSPLYKGTKSAINLTKAYEYTEDLEDLDNYPLLEDGFVTAYTDGSKETIRIFDVDPTSGTLVSGIGDAENQDKLILIDPRMSYEITFQVKQAILGDYLHLKVNLYNEDEVLLTGSPISATTGVQTNLSIDSESLNKNDEYYFIRAILFNQITEFDAKHVLDVGFGNHLILNSEGIKYMSVELGSSIDSGGSWDANNDLRIYDFKVRPLVENFSNGFVMISNVLTSFIENNSEDTNQVVENKIKRFLIPYNTTLKNQFLDELYTLTGTPLQITVIVTNETIINADNGTITINAIGGVEPYIYSIDNGTTFFDTNEFTNLPSGTYNIVVEDAESTQVTDTVEVLAGESDLAISAFATDASKFDVADGEIEILASGGTAPYYYSINGVDYFSTNIFENIAVGSYTAYIRDTDLTERTAGLQVGAVRDLLVTVNITDSDLNPLVGADVLIQGGGGGAFYTEYFTTDSSGQVIEYYSAGTYRVWANTTGYFSKNTTGIGITTDKVIDVELDIEHVLNLTVLPYGGGAVLDHYTMELTNAPAGVSFPRTFTKSSGSSISVLPYPSGDYTFTVSIPGGISGQEYWTEEFTYTITDTPATQSTNFELRRVDYQDIGAASSGSPLVVLPGASIKAKFENPPGYLSDWIFSEITDASGLTYNMPVVEGYAYTVARGSKTGYQTFSEFYTNFPVSQSPIYLSMPPT